MAESTNSEPQKVADPFKKPPPSVQSFPLSNPAHVLVDDSVITSVQKPEQVTQAKVSASRPPEIPYHDANVVSGYEDSEKAPVEPAQNSDALTASRITSIAEKLKQINPADEPLPTAAD